MDTKKIAKDNLVFTTLTGSRAYGTFTETSDWDYRSIFIIPKCLREDPFVKIENVQDKDADDSEYDELKKFLVLVSGANPNKIEILFTLPEHRTFVHPAFQPMLDNRGLFLTKRVRHTFAGYSFAQKKRLERHYNWIQKLENKTEAQRYQESPKLVKYVRWICANGIEVCPDSTEVAMEYFQGMFATKINDITYKLYRAHPQVESRFFKTPDQTAPSYIDISLQKLEELRPTFLGIALLGLEAFQADLKEYNHYLEWRNNRNKVRSALEIEHGIDTKHALHCVRLLRMVKEILLEGKVNVFRPDAQELLAVRNGSMSYKDLIDFMNETEKELDGWYEKSTLPKSPDTKAIAEVYKKCLEIYDSP